jgi:hypothetical protein
VLAALSNKSNKLVCILLGNILDLGHFVGNAPQHDDVTCVLMRAV